MRNKGNIERLRPIEDVEEIMERTKASEVSPERKPAEGEPASPAESTDEKASA
jgi:hypothetical protein